MNYRKFKLINSIGAEYDLCNLNHALYSPDGLGFDKSFDSVQVGSAFALVEDKLNQQTITGEIVFKSYEYYSEFKEFISGGSLTFAYQPRNYNIWYYRSCEVKNLKKSEIDKTTHRLHCSVDFLCFSQWYESVIAERTVYEVSENSIFPLTFPFTFADKNINEVIIVNTNVDPAPCKIEIFGPCSNPRWELKNSSGTIVNGRVSISLNEGERLIVDSNIESMCIVKMTEDSETDVYQHSDFSTGRFIYAPNGRSILRFYHDSDYALDITVEVRKVADTV